MWHGNYSMWHRKYFLWYRKYFLCTVLQIPCKTGSHTYDLHSQLPYMGATASHNQHSAHCHNFTTIHVHCTHAHTTHHNFTRVSMYTGVQRHALHSGHTTKQHVGADQIFHHYPCTQVCTGMHYTPLALSNVKTQTKYAKLGAIANFWLQHALES